MARAAASPSRAALGGGTAGGLARIGRAMGCLTLPSRPLCSVAACIGFRLPAAAGTSCRGRWPGGLSLATLARPWLIWIESDVRSAAARRRGAASRAAPGRRASRRLPCGRLHRRGRVARASRPTRCTLPPAAQPGGPRRRGGDGGAVRRSRRPPRQRGRRRHGRHLEPTHWPAAAPADRAHGRPVRWAAGALRVSRRGGSRAAPQHAHACYHHKRPLLCLPATTQTCPGRPTAATWPPLQTTTLCGCAPPAGTRLLLPRASCFAAPMRAVHGACRAHPCLPCPG